MKRRSGANDKFLGSDTIIFSTLEENLRRLASAETDEVKDEDCGRMIIEGLLTRIFYDFCKDSAKIIWAAKKIAKKLSLKDMEEISADLSDAPDQFQRLLVESLIDRGIKVPKTLEEINNFVKPEISSRE